ncbi:sodium:dicarboxylate symporter [Bacillus sp. FJAT-27916]|uniref:dicarboxylate/amino acid:cation symporter n=1 Tax=Bacillus sp. FJAT-27916 TaxID=1679169 RepID=UPI00067176FC|nr:dicarboxylate/amino acid:cation symporter [Bacillus sp. FJAT-27916]KMY44542.1 sodium:dicarboxylate symporter [Bacillus sp. FJAT-27916]
MNLTKKIIIGLVLGAAVGLILNIYSPSLFTQLDMYLFSPLGTIFINLIKLLVVPIVLFSIILGVAGLGDPKKLGSIGLKTVTYFLITTAMAIMLAMMLATVISPGTKGEFDTSKAEFSAEEAPSIAETLLGIIPSNPFQAMVNGDMLQIIFFAALIGFALTALGKKTEGIVKLIEQGNDVVMFLVTWVMKLAPYGTFGLIATAVGSQGYSAMKAMGLYMIVVVIALVIHTIVVYGGTILFVAKKNPLWFFKGFAPAMTLGFSTSSSNATLPVSMETAQDNLGVRKEISSFVQPLGATINMDGTAIMQGVATIFIAQVYDVNLTFTALITVVITAVLASIGTAGVPGVGLIMLAMVLTSVNLPVEGIGLILGIDRLLDMARTSVNITGDAACAVMIDQQERKKEKKNASSSDTVEA